MTMVKKYWTDISSEPISEEAIRALHQPNKHFKFYINTVEPGKSLNTNAGHEFMLYILAGTCKTSLEGIELILSSAEYITFEKGSYVFEADGDVDLKLVKVFSLQ